MFYKERPSLDPVILPYLKNHAKVYTLSKDSGDLIINRDDTIDIKKLHSFISEKNITHFFYIENSSYLPIFLNEFPKNVKKVMMLIDTHINKKRRIPYLSLFDYILLVNQHQLHELSQLNPNMSWLTYGADTNAFYKLPKVPKKYEVTFDGNIIPWIHYHRFFMLLYLKLRGRAVYYPKTTYLEHNQIYNQTKILLNRSPLGGWNLRVFESLSSGSLLLTDRPTNGMEKIFIDKKHLVYFDSLSDLKNKIDYYLTHEKEREEIAKNGNLFVTKNYTWNVLLKQMVETFKTMKIKEFQRQPYFLSLSNLECYSFRNKELALRNLESSLSSKEINQIQYYYYRFCYLFYLVATGWLIIVLNFIRVNLLVKPFEKKT